jgi:cobalt/nickel transport system permease protein
MEKYMDYGRQLITNNGLTPISSITRIDPRARILAALIFAVFVAWVQGIAALAIGLVAATLAGAFSGMDAATMFKRLLPLNALMFLLAVLLPLSVPGKPLFVFGPFHYSPAGLLLVARIALKGNSIVLAILALVGTMDVNTLGHALRHLHVPDRLTQLLLFTVRYLDVLHREYLRLRGAMKARGFRPRMNRHTYRSFGNLLGMLLVRGYDRAERILAAMKCRGFSGRFYLLDHFSFHRRDLVFCSLSAVIFLTMLAAEILWLKS